MPRFYSEHFSLDLLLFSCSKTSAANIGIIVILMHFEKNSITTLETCGQCSVWMQRKHSH